MKMCTLNFVDKQCEICANIKYFNRKAVVSPENRARKLLRETIYWLYDESTDSFGPSKFVGFKSMTFECYNDWVKKAKAHKGKFNGGATRRANEKTLDKKFAFNATLSEKLLEWGEKLFDVDIFENIDQHKWRFIKLRC